MTPRRRFLSWLGAASALSLTTRALEAEVSTGPDRRHPAPITDDYDVSWVARVTGKHKAVFDSPEIAEGAALFRAVAWCDHYKEVYGTERGDMSPVLVLRHSAIPLVMKDAYWSRFDIGKRNKMKGEDKKWMTTNPISAASLPESASAGRRKYLLEPFMEAGGIVLACGWAFGQVVSDYRKEDKSDQATARTAALADLIPGVIIQPNGIFAVIRAQEAGCSFVAAS
jgi:hypothetical protein